ncbi:hypothetical protein CRUP_026574 [Coryphaenoides rupestris]|nr:hypothetical protein CRUP_026574 [Coryphaenoides rupestris]
MYMPILHHTSVRHFHLQTLASAPTDDGCADVCVIGSELHLDVSYLHYLYEARRGISGCMRACQVWSAPYDGQDPPAEDHPPSAPPLLPSPLNAPPPTTPLPHPPASAQHRYGPRPVVAPLPPPSAATQLELEWDDSYDACPAQAASESENSKPLPPTAGEPPKHLQEMRRTAIMLVQGSYVEESDFQDDVMVYDLVAQRTTLDTTEDVAPHRPLPPAAATEVQVAVGSGPGRTEASEGGEEEEEEEEVEVEVERDANAHLEAPGSGRGSGDLLSQYEELIGTLSTEVGGEPPCPAPTTREEEEMEVDFSSFSADTPEPEKLPSPFIPKPRCGSRGHAVPFTGPFVSVLLSRLDNMLQNSVQVNLLLTGVVAQLAAYPQPLLRSFLLNTNMVLASIKNQGSKVNPAAPQHKGAVTLANTEVFAAVLFTEFLKELAAIAQEHSILSYVPMEE